MKSIYKILSLAVLLFALNACAFEVDSSEHKTDQVEQTGKEYTAAYICPMHCEGSGSEKEGACPICGMDYVKNEQHNHDSHSH
ncbi:heavy metal-binding domain-containing protein [Aureispira anguillae]|uniref:Heavy metal binding domain-containing protein n=1 Tax=Aureispira anguillae TaxID=2864201 RepID=A0A915YAR1_9BACT|nr:heavy metal-binding domain-containing protein [Aureispira anguillae]BDS09436.1 hypothetical protein AsAng_0001340 [Aureispira anguillae]